LVCRNPRYSASKSTGTLGPTNYTSSNTERYNVHYAKSALPSKAQASFRAAIMENFSHVALMEDFRGETPSTLSCTVSKIATIPNKVSAGIVEEYRVYMLDNGASERHQNNAVKAVIGCTNFPDENTTFYNINAREQVTTASLHTKMKSA
jgi:hypothetical protein